MGYATTYGVPSLSVSSSEVWSDTTLYITPAGDSKSYYFYITSDVNPIGTFKLEVTARSTGGAGTKIVVFYRGSTILSQSNLTNVFQTFDYTVDVTDLKHGDVFQIYCATSIGAGGDTESKDAKLYAFESTFRMEVI